MTDETRAPLPELGTNNAAGQSEGTQDAGLPDAGRQEQADAALSPGRPAGPAAPTGETPRPARPVMEEGNLSGWSVYVTSLERYTDQLERELAETRRSLAKVSVEYGNLEARIALSATQERKT